MTRRIVLASGSPRRRALLAALGVEFEVITSDAEETNSGNDPAGIVCANARLKGQDVADGVKGSALVIAADTLVFHAGHTLGKPADTDEAFRMLRALSGNTHEVITGLAVFDTGTGAVHTGHETTRVTFRELSDAEIARFIAVVNPVDRAGAYTVDGPGSLLVAGYDGCYQNVLGFPMVRLDNLLREVGLRLFDELHPERAAFL